MLMAEEVSTPLQIFKRALVVFALLFLCGCESQSALESALEEYRTRLSRVSDTDFPELILPNVLNYPSLGQMQQHVPEIDVNLRDFYRLKDCELYTLVAQRNTTTGKTQFWSQRLSYENRFLNMIDACIQTLSKQAPDLAEFLQRIKQQKQQQYKYVWANLLQNSQEMRYGLSLPKSMIDELDTVPQSALNAVMHIDARLDPIAFEPKALEEALAQVASDRILASLWQTRDYLTDNLSILSVALEKPLSEVDCKNGKASEKAKIFRNVFYLFFIEKIQPIGSHLNRIHYQVEPTLEKWSEQPFLQPEFRAYIARYGIQSAERFNVAVREHVSLWQAFFGRCGLSPTASSARN